MSYTSLSKLSAEHHEWLNGLGFYKDDLQILENRLAEVASRNTQFEARQGIEHFQNQFVIQRNHIDELRHRINEHASAIGYDASIHAGQVENGRQDEHEGLRDDYQSFEKIINELRKEFNTFLTKWL